MKQGSCTKFHLSDISSAPEAVVEAVAANTEVRRLLADQLITLCFPGGIHFCIHWPTAVQPLVEQVNTLLFLPSFRPKKLSWKKLEKLGKRFQQVASLSLSTPRCFLHFPPGPAAIYLLMQCLPILFNHFSYCNQPLFLFFLFLEFFFLFSRRGSYLGPPCLPSLGWISPHRPPGCLPPRSPEFLSPLSVSCFDHLFSHKMDCFECSPFQMCNPCK